MGVFDRFAKHAAQSLSAACGLLTLAVVIGFVVAGSVSYSMYGPTGIVATGIAAAVCWGGALVALVASRSFHGPYGVVEGLLVGMLFHMGLPLLVGTAIQRQGGPLAGAGTFGQIVIFFLLTLVVATLLSVNLIRRSALSKRS